VKNAINQFKNYENNHILNTDQYGFCYELYSNRTLSEFGEKNTVVCADSLNAISHSYTIQPLISFEGKLIGKLYICLQASKDMFGPNVLKNLQILNNVVVTYSKSGKLTKPLLKKYVNDTLKSVVSKDFILMVDSWTTYKDKSLYDEIFDDIKCGYILRSQNIFVKNFCVKTFESRSFESKVCFVQRLMSLRYFCQKMRHKLEINFLFIHIH
jgi:hypothetical protein